MTDLDALGAKWQRELRLQDWRVSYAIVPDLRGPDGRPVDACSERLVDNKTATILVSEDAADVEALVVAKLIRLHVAPLTYERRTAAAAEAQVASALAAALTDPDRAHVAQRAVMALRQRKDSPVTINATNDQTRAVLAMTARHMTFSHLDPTPSRTSPSVEASATPFPSVGDVHALFERERRSARLPPSSSARDSAHLCAMADLLMPARAAAIFKRSIRAMWGGSSR